MKSVNTVFLVLLMTLACGSNRGDPIVPGGGSGPGAGRANLAVVESNQYEACQALFELIRSCFRKAMSVSSDANNPDYSVRILGDYDGYAVVKDIETESGGTNNSQYWNMKIEYNGYYSETGELYISGMLELYGLFNNTSLSRFELNGNVEFSGDYASSVEFERFEIVLDDNGQVLDLPFAYKKYLVCGATHSLRIFGNVRFTSDGAQTLYTNPYMFDIIDLLIPPPSTCQDSLQYGCPPPGGCN